MAYSSGHPELISCMSLTDLLDIHTVDRESSTKIMNAMFQSASGSYMQ